MTNEEFIKQHRNENPLSLALKKTPEGVDLQWCLRQIEGYNIAKKKLPEWAEKENIWFPPKLSMEQCSSEATAKYKQSVAERLGSKVLIDLTGGFGIDFSYMAKNMEAACYVEQQEILCNIASHNFPLMGLQNTKISNTTCEEFWKQYTSDETSAKTNREKCLIYLDPARRNDKGEKVFSISDCTPDVTLLQDSLLEHSAFVMLKLSPMLDTVQARRMLKNIAEIHVVSVKGECKELVFVMSKKTDEQHFFCVNLDTNEEAFTSPISVTMEQADVANPTEIVEGAIIFEPNASIMKAGVQNAFAKWYNLKKFHPMSNLFVGNGPIENIPARQFVIEQTSDFRKANLKSLMQDIRQANLTIRNFPSTVDDLKKRLKIKDGGNIYLFATTLSDDTHVLIRCKRI
jgi:hypothetical protein